MDSLSVLGRDSNWRSFSHRWSHSAQTMELVLAATPPPLPLFAANFSVVPIGKVEPLATSPPFLLNATTRPSIRKEVPRPPALPPNKPDLNSGGLHIDFKGMLDSTIDSAKDLFGDMFGLNAECLNGGKRISGNKCECTYGYRGSRCEEITCENNGIRRRVERQKPPQFVCSCPHPEYITGKHCEKVVCLNNGSWSVQEQMCICDEQWYYGKFCEGKRTHLPFLIGIPLVIIAFILLMCYLCKKDWCPRQPRRGRHGMYRNGEAQSRRRPISTNRTPRTRAHATGILVQEHLLGEERGAPMRSPAYPPGIVPPFVIRLDTIPTFNPGMVGGVDPAGAGMTALELIKEIEPPPSYDQAMAVPRPPAYTASPRESQVVGHSTRGTPPLPTTVPPVAPPSNLTARSSPSSNSNSNGSSASSSNHRR
ncbi:unnamed protein product, partial [Mesorhabditis belari]|uniref:EGF-like domain-containing protein n=1 Tax=Mesorhabditis belari TaxID=2138241 RepID=A0AAF3F2N8_9BILA